MILLIHPGQARQNNGGNPMPIKIGSWVDLYGQVLITGENPRLMDGPVSTVILELWICAGFLKIFITTIKAGGRIKMYCSAAALELRVKGGMTRQYRCVGKQQCR